MTHSNTHLDSYRILPTFQYHTHSSSRSQPQFTKQYAALIITSNHHALQTTAYPAYTLTHIHYLKTLHQPRYTTLHPPLPHIEYLSNSKQYHLHIPFMFHLHSIFLQALYPPPRYTAYTIHHSKSGPKTDILPLHYIFCRLPHHLVNPIKTASPPISI